MLGGEEREMSILFSDVRGFTTISELYKDDPQGLTSLMNSFLTPLTNAIIERKGARTALITTAGFRDVLEMGYEKRYEHYDLQLELPAPLVPRALDRMLAGDRADLADPAARRAALTRLMLPAEAAA